MDALIAPNRTAELAIAHSRVDTLADDSVTVYDRNFCTYGVMALHLWSERPKYFLIRAKEKLRFVSEFLAGGGHDQVITVYPTNAETISKMRESSYCYSYYRSSYTDILSAMYYPAEKDDAFPNEESTGKLTVNTRLL